MDYKKTAHEILTAIGGKDNLASAAHCATRLRLVIADNSKVNKPVLENIDGVKGVFEASGQLQVIIGTGTETRSTMNSSLKRALKPLQRRTSRPPLRRNPRGTSVR